MNRLLRYTLLLVACLIAVWAKGQTTYIIQSGEVTLSLNQSKTHDNLPNVPLASMSITIKKSRSTSIGKTLIYYNNSEVKSLSPSDVTTSYKTFSGISLGGIGGSIKVDFPTGGSYNRVYKDLIVTQQRYLRFSDGTTATKSIAFGTRRVGTSTTETITVDYSDVSVTASLSDATNFSVSQSSFGNNSGAYEPSKQLTVTYNPTTVGSHSSVLTLTAANGNVIKVNLSGTANNQVNPVINGSDKTDAKVGRAYNAGFSFSDVSTATPSSSSADNFYYTISHNVTATNTAGSPDATKVIAYDPATNTITPLNAGTASITFTQKETSDYYAATKTFNVAVSKNANTISLQGLSGTTVSVAYGKQYQFVSNNNATRPAFVVNQTAGSGYATYNEPYIQTYFQQGQAVFAVSQAEDYMYESASATFTLNIAQTAKVTQIMLQEGEEAINVYSGTQTYNVPFLPDRLYIDINKQGAGTGDFTIKYNGGTVHNFANGDLSTSYTTYDFELDHTQTGNVEISSAGTLSKHYRNLYVTAYTYLRAEDQTINVVEGASGTATMQVDWSITNGGELKIYNDNPTDFSISKTGLGNADNSHGSTSVTITFQATDNNSSTSVAHLYIYNEVDCKVVTVTGNTMWKPTSERYRIKTGDNYVTAGVEPKAGASHLAQAFVFTEKAPNTFGVTYGDGQTLYETVTTEKAGGVWYVKSGGSTMGAITDDAVKHDCTLSVGEAGWGTFIAPYPVTLPDGVTAYTLTGMRVCDKLKLDKVSGDQLAANTPYLLKGAGTASYSDYGTATADSYGGAGSLTGTYIEHTTVPGEYVLQQHVSGTGFFLVDDVTPTVQPSRCYIATQPSSAVRAYMMCEDDVLQIVGDEAASGTTPVYTLSGISVQRSNLRPGMYIMNGKKTIIK